MNLGQLRAQIDRRTGVEQNIQAATAYINEAVNIISSRREWPWLDSLQTITIDTATTYAVATDYSETKTINVDGVEAKLINVADGDDFDSVNTIPWSYLYTLEWDAGLAELKFFPQPPAGTTVLHRYTKAEALLASDSDSPSMPERYHTVICDYAAGLFLERVSPERSATYLQRGEKAIKDMYEATQRKSNPGRIRIRRGAGY